MRKSAYFFRRFRPAKILPQCFTSRKPFPVARLAVATG